MGCTHTGGPAEGRTPGGGGAGQTTTALPGGGQHQQEEGGHDEEHPGTSRCDGGVLLVTGDGSFIGRYQ